MTTRRRLPWYSRLSVRLAALLTVVILTFDFCTPYAYRALGHLLSLRLDGNYYINYDDWSEEEEGRARVPEAVSACALAILDQATSAAAAGARSPTAGSKQDLAAELQQALMKWRPDEARVFYVTDTKYRVLSASESLRAELGEGLSLSGRQQEFGRQIPLRREANLVGWLCIVPPPSSALAAGFAEELPGDAVVLSEAEAIENWERIAFLHQLVKWLARAAIALVAGLFVSWLVSRRLVRLAEVTDVASNDRLSDASVVRVSGSDEIARLSDSLAAARARVGALLAEMADRDVKRREWIAQVSHDLRTPLTALIARLERAAPLVGDLTEGPVRHELADAVLVAQHDAERVGALARDLLDAARLDLPDALQFEPLLVGELLGRVRAELAPLAVNAELELDLEVSPDIPIVRGDGSRLLRVLENLVRNAIEHASSRIEIRAVPIAVEGVEAGGVEIQVRDDGPGIRQADDGKTVTQGAEAGSSHRRGDSTGLGLHITRRILAAHGSELFQGNRRSGGCVSRFELAADGELRGPGRADSAT